MAKKLTARTATLPEDFQKLGLKKEIAQWEDGLRTSGKKGEFEWWYFDFKLPGDTSLVIVFYTTTAWNRSNGFAPYCSFTLTRPGHEKLEDKVSATMEDASFCKDGCDVRIGACAVSGDLHSYTLHWKSEKLTADITLTGRTPAWRPATGHLVFEDGHYFAWLPSVPEGEAQISMTMDGKTETFTGTGYHDHNWGDTAMFDLMHHWYWGRAKIGDYQVISSYITGREKYGYPHFPIFMLAKNGVLLADDFTKVRYTQAEPVLEPNCGKHFHKTLIYDYEDEDQHYRISYLQEELLEKGKKKRSKAKDLMMRIATGIPDLEPAYLRMTGTARIERIEDGNVVETVEAPALWELMYFGKDAEV